MWNSIGRGFVWNWSQPLCAWLWQLRCSSVAGESFATSRVGCATCCPRVEDLRMSADGICQQLRATTLISSGQAADLCLKSVAGIKRPIAHIERGVAAKAVDYFFALAAFVALTD